MDDVILPRLVRIRHAHGTLPGRHPGIGGSNQRRLCCRSMCLTHLLLPPAPCSAPQTRQRLCAELETLADKKVWRPERKHGNIPL